MQNAEPLEKQLLQLDIGKGVNERDRPETAPVTTTLTRVENLIYDQSGAAIKRYGTPILGATTDDTGTAIGYPTKLLRMKNGLGMVNSYGNFYQYMEAAQRFTNKDEMPDVVISSAEQVLSSGPEVTPKIRTVASSTKYHAMVCTSGAGGAPNNGMALVLYDRNSGAVVLTQVLSDLLGLGVTSVKIVFVGDRYLHVYMVAGGLDLYGVVYDTVTLPIAGTAPVLISTGVILVSILDHDYTTDRSFVLESTDGTVTIHAMANDGTIFVTTSGAVVGALKMSVSGTRVWFVTAANKESRLTTDLGTVVNAPAAHGFANVGYIVANVLELTNIYESAVAFGATTIKKIDVSFNGGAPLVGWKIASAPFLGGTRGEVYFHATKDTGGTIVQHALIKATLWVQNTDTGANTYYSFRIAAVLDPMLGVENSNVLKYFPDTNNRFCPAAALQTVSRGYSYTMYTVRQFDHSRITSVVFGGQNYISGGVHCAYAGDRIQECGFVDSPLLNTAVSAAAGPTGSFKHVIVYRYVDETGAVTWSRVSSVSSTTTVAKGIDAVACPPTATLKDKKIGSGAPPYRTSIELYRTTSGGTQYYLAASSQVGTPATGLSTQVMSLAVSGYFTVTDAMTDATLVSQPLLFRQPGTPNSGVDRYPPPAGNILCQHKDRLFTTDPQGVRVYYSSFFVDGETAWYNPAFSFFVHGGSGPITAMVSMDGRLFVFKRDGIFVVDGDGPAEGGVSGNEFSPPQRLATEYGCIDARSVVVTTDGTVYRSARGVEILTRSLQVKWLGDKVQNTVNANPKTTGAVLDTFGRVHIGLAAFDVADGLQTATTGCEAVYDFTGDSWTVSYHTDVGGTYGRCIQDVCQADIYGVGETLCYADAAGAVVYTDTTEATGLDRGSYYVPWTVETGWIRAAQQSRARFSKAMMLAKKLAGANHRIKISVAFNYIDSYTQTKTWEPNTINAAGIEELMVNLTSPQVLAVRIKIEENKPTDTGTYPIGTGRGADLLGIAFEIAPKTGAPKLASDQKG